MGLKFDEFVCFVDVYKVFEYVEKRRYEDGGYCFVSVLNDINVNDIYYVVKMYDLFGFGVFEKEKMIEFFERVI